VRVSLFVTCLNDALYPATGIATVRLLERLGHDVDFPSRQTCCGQMHLNSGYAGEAARLARRFVATFADAEFVVAPSASCVGMVHDYYPYLAEQTGDGELARAVDELAPRVLELSQFLTSRLHLEDVGASFPHRVTYHSTCHSLRMLRVGTAPLRLLRGVRGLELAELPDAEECCGFGGTFAVKNAETSSAMVQDKVDAIVRTGAEVVTSLDNSCLMNIGGSLSRRGADVRVMHLAEILATVGP
jgi:L-lactate dehydrogenase complex protein LldE